MVLCIVIRVISNGHALDFLGHLMYLLYERHLELGSRGSDAAWTAKGGKHCHLVL